MLIKEKQLKRERKRKNEKEKAKEGIVSGVPHWNDGDFRAFGDMF